MATVRQQRRGQPLARVAASVRQTLQSAIPFTSELTGLTVGIAVGSRGIDQVDRIVSETARYFVELGANVVVIPAMGSHGGGTPAGQTKLLGRIAGVAIDQINADTTTRVVGNYSTGHTIHASEVAIAVDRLIVINRVRPHTMFSGPIESGLCKMLAVGLGKPAGAQQFHLAARAGDFTSLIEQAVSTLLSVYPLIGGLAIVENSEGLVSSIDYVAPQDFLPREKSIKAIAESQIPQLPFNSFDLLIIDEIGKDISGTGMDTVVVKRKTNPNQAAGSILVLGLSQATAGNAYGLGYADMTTQSVVDAIDPSVAAANQAASGNPLACRVPAIALTGRDAVDQLVARYSQGLKVIRIRDTKHLEVVEVSRAYEAELGCREDLQQVTPWRTMEFINDELSPIATPIEAL